MVRRRPREATELFPERLSRFTPSEWGGDSVAAVRRWGNARVAFFVAHEGELGCDLLDVLEGNHEARRNL